MKTEYFFTVTVALLLLSLKGEAKAPSTNIDEGKSLFASQCASCHNVNVKLVGPALADVDHRHSADWIVKFVQSSQAMVKSNDKEAVALFGQFNQTVMTDHPDISAEQVGNIVAYIKSQAKAPAAEAAPFATPHMFPPNNTPILITDIGFFGTYLGTVLLLVACLVFAVKVKEIERGSRKNKAES